MKGYLLLSGLVTLVLGQSANSSNGLLVSTNVGTFQGQYSSPTVRNWLGIRYGKSTNGTRRFRRPQRADVLPTDQVFNASSFSPSCGQNGGGGNRTTYGDDCLSLNIWAPATSRSNSSSLTPVMIWIYGGGFLSGSSSLSLYNGNNFVRDQDNLTVVTINYRTSLFGFPAGSSLGPLELNPGLQDQRLAVEWVYNNIREFGGDPSKITLFGESAGAESIGAWQHAYEFDPIAQGLILQSGSEFLLTATTAKFNATNTNTAWQTVSNMTGCGQNATTTPAQQLTCMQNVDFDTLQTTLNMASGSRNFLPTVDGILVFSQEEYMRRDQAGQFAQLPLLLGNNNNEGTTLVGSYASGTGGSDFAVNFITQFSFTCPAAQVAASHTNSSSLSAPLPTWQYRYFGTWPNITPPNSTLGAFHGSEITMVFGNYNSSMSNPVSQAQIRTSQTMQGAWAAFAKDPQTGLTEYGWPIFSANGTSMIEIAKNYYNVSSSVLATDLPIVTFNSSQAYNTGCSVS